MAQSDLVYWIDFNKEALYKSGQGVGSIIQRLGVETTSFHHPKAWEGKAAESAAALDGWG